MLIDIFIFKEITSHVEGLCTIDDINEIRGCLNNKIVEAIKKAADKLIYRVLKKRRIYSSDLTLLQKEKTRGIKHYYCS